MRKVTDINETHPKQRFFSKYSFQANYVCNETQSALLKTGNEKPQQKKKTTNLVDDIFEPNKNHKTPLSPELIKRSVGRASFLNNVHNISLSGFELGSVSHKKSNNQDNLIQMMRKSILDLNKKDSLFEKFEGVQKDDILQSLSSGKFSFSQLLDVI